MHYIVLRLSRQQFANRRGVTIESETVVGAPPDVCEDIRQAEMARYAAERMAELGLVDAFHHALARRVVQTLAARYPEKFTLKVLVCDFEGNKIAEAAGNERNE